MVRVGNIVTGPKLHIPVPDNSLGRAMYDFLNKYGNNLALINELSKEQLTYGQLQTIVCKLAVAIKNCGCTQSDLLGVCSENSIYFFSPVLAGVYLGIPIVLISRHYSQNEIQHTLNVTKVKLVFCSKYTAKAFVDLQRSNSFIQRIIIMNSKEALPGTLTLDGFIKTYVDDFPFYRFLQPVNVDTVNHTAFILFSSGTTGLPKGVMITHSNCLMTMVHALDPRLYRSSFGGTVYLGYLPFCHASGLLASFTVLTTGKPIVILEIFEERLFLSCIDKYKVNSIILVPTLMVMLSKSSILQEYDISCLEEVLAGAAPINESLEQEMKKRLRVESVKQCYGLTEATFIVISMRAGVNKPGSVGTLTPEMSAVIRDPQTGKILGPNQVGEICLKGGMIMKGYYGNPQATKDAFTEDGWLRSGDLGYYDEEEYFYIVDRLKDLIKYKSFQVAPAEIEGLLQKHPKVKEAAVVGLPDERAGELPMAFIVKQPGVHVTDDEIMEFVASSLSKHKHLHGGVRFIDDIPKNLTGKMLRKELRKMIGKQVSNL